MRITALKVMLANGFAQGVGAAKRAGLAVARRVRPGDHVEVAVSVGDDESRFGGAGSRAWLQFLEECRSRMLEIFEKSRFERQPRLERFFRRWLGLSRAYGRRRAPLLLDTPFDSRETEVVQAYGAEQQREAARLKAQVRDAILQAHTGGRAGLLDRVANQRERADSAARPDG